jgi:hypothetical protein
MAFSNGNYSYPIIFWIKEIEITIEDGKYFDLEVEL